MPRTIAGAGSLPAVPAWQSSVWRNIRPLKKSRYCSRASDVAGEARRQRSGLHLEHVRLGEEAQPVACGVGGEVANSTAS